MKQTLVFHVSVHCSWMMCMPDGTWGAPRDNNECVYLGTLCFTVLSLCAATCPKCLVFVRTGSMHHVQVGPQTNWMVGILVGFCRGLGGVVLESVCFMLPRELHIG